jgi:hypothetical protein
MHAFMHCGMPVKPVEHAVRCRPGGVLNSLILVALHACMQADMLLTAGSPADLLAMCQDWFTIACLRSMSGHCFF